MIYNYVYALARAHGDRQAGWQRSTNSEDLMSPLMLTLAAELTDAQADGDAASLAVIAWRLFGQAGESLAEIGRLRAAIHAAWNRPPDKAVPAPAAA